MDITLPYYSQTSYYFYRDCSARHGIRYLLKFGSVLLPRILRCEFLRDPYFPYCRLLRSYQIYPLPLRIRSLYSGEDIFQLKLGVRRRMLFLKFLPTACLSTAIPDPCPPRANPALTITGKPIFCACFSACLTVGGGKTWRSPDADTFKMLCKFLPIFGNIDRRNRRTQEFVLYVFSKLRMIPRPIRS